jgi:hypothetical protein
MTRMTRNKVDTTFERHYSIADIAVEWKLSQETVRQRFKDDPESSTPSSVARAPIRCMKQDASYATSLTGLKPSNRRLQARSRIWSGSHHASTERTHEAVNGQSRRSSHEPAKSV